MLLREHIQYLYIWLKSSPFEGNGPAGQAEVRCSGGETGHSASENFLHIEVKHKL